MAVLKPVLQHWKQTLRRNAADARLMLSKLILGRLVLTPEPGPDGDGGGAGGYRFNGTGTLQQVIAGVVPHELPSPAGIGRLWKSAG